MKSIFWGGYLVAVLATGCHSSPTPGDTTSSAAAAAQPTSAATASALAPPEHQAGSHAMAAMPGMASPIGPSARAEAMRLHDAAMNQMDALTTEQQRLTSALAKLTAATPRATRLRRTVTALRQADQQMMGWMHQLQEPDSTTQSRAQVEAYWRHQLPGLRQLDQHITAALDSAKTLR